MGKFSDTYRIRVADLSFSGRLKESALFAMLQEVACEHADILHVGMDDLSPKNLGWAVSKIDLTIFALPEKRSRIVIETWPSGRSKAFCERDFRAIDQNGKVLFEARSIWILFDLVKRRMERTSVLHEWENEPERVAGDCSEKLLPATEAQFSKKVVLRRDDIDVNGHLNNCVYPALAIDSLPESFYAKKMPRRIRISFLSEMKESDNAISTAQITGDTSLHSICNAETNKEFARINIDWRNI